MSEALLDIKDQASNETANGRFFIPGDSFIARRFLDESENFWHENQDLLPKGVGVVLQDRASEESQEDSRTATLYFDARNQQERFYIWHLSKVHESGTKTMQLSVTPSNVFGTIYSRDTQGRLASQKILDTHQLTKEIYEILQHRSSVETEGIVLRTQVQKAKSDVEIFATSPQISIKYDAKMSDGMMQTKESVVTLTGVAFEKELRQRRAHIQQIGFCSVEPQAPSHYNLQLKLPLFREFEF